MTMGVRVIVQSPENEVLLVRHTYVSGWHLPGGGIETGEVAAETVRKEVHEEANIRVCGSPRLLSVHQNRLATKRDHVLLYHVDEWEREGKFIPNREIAEIGFFAPDSLPEGTTPSTRRRLEEFFHGKPADDFW